MQHFKTILVLVHQLGLSVSRFTACQPGKGPLKDTFGTVNITTATTLPDAGKVIMLVFQF
jgi:hypothetical protein